MPEEGTVTAPPPVEEEEETTPAQTGNPFGGGAPASEETTPAAPPAATPPQQEGAPPEGEEAAAPDLSEQEQALVQKLAGPLGDAVAARVNDEPGEAEEATPLGIDDTVARLLQHGQEQLGQEEGGEGGEPQQGQEPGYEGGEPYGQEQPGGIDPDDPVLQHPVVQALIQQHGATQEILGGILQQNQEDALHKLADANPDLREEDTLTAVEAVAGRLAERAGRPELATDPAFVETALRAVRASRATPTEVSAEEARNQGASLETEAGASAGGEPDPEDEWWGRVSGAGGNAFPS